MLSVLTETIKGQIDRIKIESIVKMGLHFVEAHVSLAKCALNLFNRITNKVEPLPCVGPSSHLTSIIVPSQVRGSKC